MKHEDELSKALEALKQVQRITNNPTFKASELPYKRIIDDLKASNSQWLKPTSTSADMFRREAERQRQMQEAILRSGRELSSAFGANRQLAEAAKRAYDREGAMAAFLGNQRFDLPKTFGALFNQDSKFIQSLKSSSAADKRFQTMLQQSTMASSAWRESMELTLRKFTEIDLVNRNEALAQRLLAPHRNFVAFSQHTAERIEEAESENEVQSLQASLELADTQLIATSENLSDILAIPDDNIIVSAEPKLILFYEQQQEIVDQVRSEHEDPSVLFATTNVAQVAANAHKVTSLIVKCNRVARTSGKDEIFKPTTKVLEVFSDLPLLLPTTENSFKDFVDYLYFLFYEGAGTDKLRFLQGFGGPFDKSDPICDLIWCIKHLRNKWARHNIERGSEGEIRKNWADLAGQFNRLNLDHYPVAESDFRELHARLLQNCVNFLEKLLQEMIGHGRGTVS